MCQGIIHTRDFTQQIFFSLMSIILSHLRKTLSRILKIQMISYVSWLAFLLCQMMLHYVTAQKMMFSIKDFFSKYYQIRRKLRIRIWSYLLKKSLMKNFIFCAVCTIDVAGLYPNISHDEGLIAMRKDLDLLKGKIISTESLIELAKCVLKNNTFEHSLSFYKQLRGTAISTKMAPPYAIIFFSDLEERFFSDCEISPLIWWRYIIDDIFML